MSHSSTCHSLTGKEDSRKFPIPDHAHSFVVLSDRPADLQYLVMRLRDRSGRLLGEIRPAADGQLMPAGAASFQLSSTRPQIVTVCWEMMDPDDAAAYRLAEERWVQAQGSREIAIDRSAKAPAWFTADWASKHYVAKPGTDYAYLTEGNNVLEVTPPADQRFGYVSLRRVRDGARGIQPSLSEFWRDFVPAIEKKVEAHVHWVDPKVSYERVAEILKSKEKLVASLRRDFGPSHLKCLCPSDVVDVHYPKCPQSASSAVSRAHHQVERDARQNDAARERVCERQRARPTPQKLFSAEARARFDVLAKEGPRWTRDGFNRCQGKTHEKWLRFLALGYEQAVTSTRTLPPIATTVTEAQVDTALARPAVPLT